MRRSSSVDLSADAVRNERAKVLDALPRWTAEDVARNVVRGQYTPGSIEGKEVPGYETERGQPSGTETFVALRADIDNWRWAGVPFFLRTGKRLPTTQTELRLVFKKPPRLNFWHHNHRPEPNQLVIKLDPSTGVRLVVDARKANEVNPSPIELDMEFSEEGGEGAAPYEVLLHAAMLGDRKRFTRQDGVEETWRIMQPLLDSPPPVQPYTPGSWGPAAADDLVAGHSPWHDPWMGDATVTSD